MRIFSIYAAVLTVAFSGAQASADDYRGGDAAPALSQVTSNVTGSKAYGLASPSFSVSPRNDRDGDAAPTSTVVNSGSVSGAVAFGISNTDARSGSRQHFTSPRFE